MSEQQTNLHEHIKIILRKQEQLEQQLALAHAENEDHRRLEHEHEELLIQAREEAERWKDARDILVEGYRFFALDLPLMAELGNWCTPYTQEEEEE